MNPSRTNLDFWNREMSLKPIHDDGKFPYSMENQTDQQVSDVFLVNEEPLDLSTKSKARAETTQFDKHGVKSMEPCENNNTFFDNLQLFAKFIQQAINNGTIQANMPAFTQLSNISPATKRLSTSNVNEYEIEAQISRKLTRSSDSDNSSESSSSYTMAQHSATTSAYPRTSAKCQTLIEIGPNGTQIDKTSFERLSWHSATIATRKLLMLIFSAEILETHTLSGKPSAAFHGRERPLKNRLSENIVADIIHCVTAQCPDARIRNIRATITAKCADMSKKKRKSLMKMTANSTHSSDE